MKRDYRVSIQYKVLDIARSSFVVKSRIQVVSARSMREAAEIAWNRIIGDTAFCKQVSCHVEASCRL